MTPAERSRRYNRSEKGRARNRKYDASDKGKARWKRHMIVRGYLRRRERDLLAQREQVVAKLEELGKGTE